MKSRGINGRRLRLECAARRGRTARTIAVLGVVGLGLLAGTAESSAARLHRAQLALSHVRRTRRPSPTFARSGGAAARAPLGARLRGAGSTPNDLLRSAIPANALAAGLGGSAQITGTVTAAATSAPIKGIAVCAYQLFGSGEVCAQTNAGGQYALTELPAEEYVVEFFVPLGSSLNYVPQSYGEATGGELQAVVLPEATAASGIDAAMLAGGALTGTVKNGEAKPIAGIEVCAFDVEGFYASCAITNAGGEYQVADLGSGQYAVEFWSPFESGLNYITQFYKGAGSFGEAQLVPVSAPGTTAGINATLKTGGQITGTVTSAASKGSLEGIVVCAYGEESEYERCALSGSSGQYAVVGLQSGHYGVQFAATSSGPLNYAPQYYNGKALPREAELVGVLAGGTKSGVDAAMLPGGQIGGRVRAWGSGASLEGIVACALPSGPEQLFGCSSGSLPDGFYAIVSLAAGKYKVAFLSRGEYALQFYKEASTFAGAQELTLAAGGVLEGINAELKLSVPRALTSPRISGSAVEGSTLSVVHAAWTNHPTSYLDQWGRCDSTGSNCFTIATGASYALQPADGNHTIRVRESASNLGGSGAFAYSTATAVVAPATSTEGSARGTPSGTTPVSPPPIQGVLASGAALPSVAQLKALLAHLLAPAGRGARIGALLKRGSYSASFRALTAGRLTISWFVVPRGAHLAAAKPILVAAGRVSPAAAGPASIKVRLTSKGRRLLAHAHRLKITVKGTLAASGQSTISAKRAVTLKR